jgi:hypothetical protein
MREPRTSLAVLGTLLLTGCGGGTPTGGLTLTPGPSVSTKSVMECLNQEAEKLGYKVIRLDREDGDMYAERRDKKPELEDPRTYAVGDAITVSHQKTQGGVTPLSIVPSSFTVRWLVNGANQDASTTRETAKADANTLVERCKL